MSIKNLIFDIEDFNKLHSKDFKNAIEIMKKIIDANLLDPVLLDHASISNLTTTDWANKEHFKCGCCGSGWFDGEYEFEKCPFHSDAGFISDAIAHLRDIYFDLEPASCEDATEHLLNWLYDEAGALLPFEFRLKLMSAVEVEFGLKREVRE